MARSADHRAGCGGPGCRTADAGSRSRWAIGVQGAAGNRALTGTVPPLQRHTAGPAPSQAPTPAGWDEFTVPLAPPLHRPDPAPVLLERVYDWFAGLVPPSVAEFLVGFGSGLLRNAALNAALLAGTGLVTGAIALGVANLVGGGIAGVSLGLAVGSAAVVVPLLLVGLVTMGDDRIAEFVADQGRPPTWYEWAGLRGLGVLDLAGVARTAEGLAGRRLTGGELTPREAGDRTASIVDAVILAGPLRAGLRAIRHLIGAGAEVSARPPANGVSVTVEGRGTERRVRVTVADTDILAESRGYDPLDADPAWAVRQTRFFQQLKVWMYTVGLWAGRVETVSATPDRVEIIVHTRPTGGAPAREIPTAPEFAATGTDGPGRPGPVLVPGSGSHPGAPTASGSPDGPSGGGTPRPGHAGTVPSPYAAGPPAPTRAPANLRLTEHDGVLELNGVAIPLTGREFRIMRFLRSVADRVVTLAEINAGAWGGTGPTAEVTDLIVASLGQRLATIAGHPVLVVVESGRYCWTGRPPAAARPAALRGEVVDPARRRPRRPRDPVLTRPSSWRRVFRQGAVSFEGITLEPSLGAILVYGKRVPASRAEFHILYLLLANQDRPVTDAELAAILPEWKPALASIRSVLAYMGHPGVIRSEPGVGHRLLPSSELPAPAPGGPTMHLDADGTLTVGNVVTLLGTRRTRLLRYLLDRLGELVPTEELVAAMNFPGGRRVCVKSVDLLRRHLASVGAPYTVDTVPGAGIRLRRSDAAPAAGAGLDLTPRIDSRQMIVTRGGRRIELSRETHAVLLVLDRRRGEVVPVEEIVAQVSGATLMGNPVSIVERLRQALNAAGPEILHHLPGQGYRYAP